MQIKILRIFETLSINRRVILLMMYSKHIDILNVLDLPCLCTCMYMCDYIHNLFLAHTLHVSYFSKIWCITVSVLHRTYILYPYQLSQ